MQSYTQKSIIDQIEKLTSTYNQPIHACLQYEKINKINDHDIFAFFTHYGMTTRKEKHELEAIIRRAKKLLSKKISHNPCVSPENKVAAIEKVQQLIKLLDFIQIYQPMYAALQLYHELSTLYFHVDENDPMISSAIINNPKLVGLKNVHNRGLYKLIKKIDLDLRRISAVYNQNIVIDTIIMKLNQIKTKILTMRNAITSTELYKKQIQQTRILKALGVILPIGILLTASWIFALPSVWTMQTAGYNFASSYLLATPLICYPFVAMGITIHELRESSKYNIPVHSRSLFSWFRPIFFPLTWVERV